jgi:uncharacterized RDD family membrane protein YckC
MQKPTQVVVRRVAAYLIDGVILAAIIAAGWYLLTKNAHPGSCGGGGGIEISGKCRGFTQSSHRTIWIAISAIAAIGIFIFMQGLTGRTPGKAIVGIKVIKGDGGVPGIGRAFVRELLWIIDGLPVLNLVGLVTALVSANNQRVGDMVAGTYVVDRNFAGALGAPQAGGAAISAPPPSGEPVGAPPQQQ